MKKTYVEQREGGYWVRGTRISLDSIVYAFNRGAAPESIRRSFPLLTLEEIYGAIAFYLAHQKEIDAYLEQGEAALDAQAREINSKARATKPALFNRLNKVRPTREPTRR